MKKRIVIALGGNALGNTPYEQLELVKKTALPIVDLIENGNEVVIVHGNGPQVGMINVAMSVAAFEHYIKSDMPFPECDAMSQGYIGYQLQNAIYNELVKRNIKKNVATIITQVLVNENDEAFKNPTKPIGAFYTKDEAEILTKEKGYTMIEDAGRGYRQVVPSPKPIDIIEKEIINNLVNEGNIIITAGGGGIPVIKKENQLVSVPAVIDKDFASSKLAELLKADALIILTAIDSVCINYGKANEIKLEKMTIEEAEKYCNEGQFAPGSMLPKVEACIEFAKTGGEAIISSLENAALSLQGRSGTRIIQ